MQKENQVNRIFAGVAFIASFLIYLRTIAPTVSFWDCGEFITCSYILGIPHPPGAPFYLLLGRIFSMIPFATDIGLRINVVSALSSSLTVMLTYLIIVRFIKQWRGKPKNSEDMIFLVASGLIGSLAFAFTDTFWFNAVEAEVYAISMFFTAIIVWLILVWHEKSDQPGSERYLLIMAYLVGLAIGVHLLMILGLPAVGLIVYFKYLKDRNQQITLKNFAIYCVAVGVMFIAIYPGIVQWVPNIAGKTGLWFILALFIVLLAGAWYAVKNHQKVLSLALMAGVLVMVGYSTYSIIYIRSGLNPAIDENDPEDMPGMVRYLNREQYGQWSTFPRRYPGLAPEWQFKQQNPGQNYATYNLGKQMDFMWNYQMKKMYWRYFAWQFIGKGTALGPDNFIAANFSLKGLMMLPFLIGMIGMVHHFYRNWRHAFSMLAFFFLMGIAIVIYLNQEDPQPRERDYVFVGSYFVFAIWIGIGVSAILEWIQESFGNRAAIKKSLYGLTIILFTFMVPVNLIAHNFISHDRTGNYVAYDYSYNILQSVEPDGIVFTNGDNDTFPLWFLQEVYGIRKDVRVVNLSLLNTPWYIKQLKSEGPRVPISFTDAEIDALELRPWRTTTVTIPVPQNAQQNYKADFMATNHLTESDIEIPSAIKINVEPTVYNQAIRIQDIMVLNIVSTNRWKKPIHFAVTVSNDNKINLDNYLRMDGLGFKLVPYEGDNVAIEYLRKNLFDVYQYRGLNDPSVYLEDNVKGLLQNYRAAFLRLAHEYMKKKDHANLAATLDKMNEYIPMDNIPLPDVRLALQIGQMYDIAGEDGKFIEYAEWAVSADPGNALANGTLVSLYSRDKKHDKAIELLENWLLTHPDDRDAKQKLEQEKTLLAIPKTAPVDTAKGTGDAG